MATDAPSTLAGYTLVERIGAGGMGEVWRAERVGAGNVRRRVAVKRILQPFRDDRVLLERFVAEARITARLEHPNVVQLIDFGDDPEPYLVLEYVEGIAVSTLLKLSAGMPGLLTLPAAIYIAAEAATGLDHAHRRADENGRPLDIVHRDVSPANILLSLDGAVKVGDFGVARAADNIMRTTAGVAVGKLNYMAPEQAAAAVLDHRADLFSLGVVLWELITHRPLIPRSNMMAALAALNTCNFPAPSMFARAVPPELDALVAEALSADRARRPSSGARMANALRTLLARVAPGYGGHELSHIVRACAPEQSARTSPKSLTRTMQQSGAVSYAPGVATAAPTPMPAMFSRASLDAARPSTTATLLPPPRTRRSRGLSVALVGAGIATVIAAAVASGVYLQKWRALASGSNREQAARIVNGGSPAARGATTPAAPSAAAPPMSASCADLAACCRAVEGSPSLDATICQRMGMVVATGLEANCSQPLYGLRLELERVHSIPPACITRLMAAPAGHACEQLAPCCDALDALPLHAAGLAYRTVCRGSIESWQRVHDARFTDPACLQVAAEIPTLPSRDPSAMPLPPACR